MTERKNEGMKMKRKKMSACLPLFPHLTKINMWRRKRKRETAKKEKGH